MTKVIDQLKQIQADLHLLITELHNYHWNVKGLQFVSVHNYTEAAYDAAFEAFDQIAERVLQVGGKPYVCNKAMAEAAKLPIAKKDSFTAKEVAENMKVAYEYMLKEFKKLAELAEKEGDNATVAMCDDYIGKYEKDLWMLRSMLA